MIAFWHRRDIRLEDNAGLYRALKTGKPVLPLFIFDENILERLEDKKDARVQFIHQSLCEMKLQLETMGSSLLVKHGRPLEVWGELIKTYPITAVYTNHDYEPYAQTRDAEVEKLLKENNIEFHHFKDHVIFEKDEVLKSDGTPYTVFTPYSRRWREKLNTQIWKDGASYFLTPYPNEKYFKHFHQVKPLEMPSLGDMGFELTDIVFPGTEVKQSLIKEYEEKRNFPAIAGTSRLGLHFRFGTISIRAKARKAQGLSETFLSELIWRDFYAQILGNFPRVANSSFRSEYDRIQWRDAPEDFQKWCEGKTGYTLVDAGMRELNATGFMHNRVRMLVASFLTKHLLIDWRLGEAYFAQKLLDFDLASNSGGWQWAAGCGTDAAPYFRIFSPMSQQEKFDKDFTYVKRWVPEYGTARYPKPMVEHTFARDRCLKAYKEGLGK